MPKATISLPVRSSSPMRPMTSSARPFMIWRSMPYAWPPHPVPPRTPVTAPRIALMHTWLATQTEGWWRYAFDTAGVPYDYISTQTAAKQDDLRSKYDVIVFAPVSRVSASDIVNGTPQWSNPMPWKKTDLTPNLEDGGDSTDDVRPGLGYDGLAHLRKFVEQGGLLITYCEDTAQFAIDTGLAPGVSVAPPPTRALSARCSTRSSSHAIIPSLTATT